jgi:threonine/homoserine/homoserine lactone efflux protein
LNPKPSIEFDRYFRLFQKHPNVFAEYILKSFIPSTFFSVLPALSFSAAKTYLTPLLSVSFNTLNVQQFMFKISFFGLTVVVNNDNVYVYLFIYLFIILRCIRWLFFLLLFQTSDHSIHQLKAKPKFENKN